MPGYSPHGRAHSVLRRPVQGSATFDGLQAYACNGVSKTKVQKFRFVMKSLTEDDLIERDGRAYEITQAGRAALRTLDAGQMIEAEPRPTVRVFVRREAAHG